jgi:aryl-alcohol dehydrogenase-like predicted oxidoreductase
MFGKTVRKLSIKRSDLVVSSKIFNHYNNIGLGPNEIGLSRKHLREGMEGILERLQMEYVDVISAHRPDHLTPIEETVRGFNWLIDQGHALYWGTSMWSAQQLTEAHEIAKRLDMVGPVAEQPPYSMLNRTQVEDELMPVYQNYGLGTMCYSPLAGGVLSGKYSALAGEGAVDATSRFVQRGGPPPDQVEKADALRPFCAELGWCVLCLPLILTVVSRASFPVVCRASQSDSMVQF